MIKFVQKVFGGSTKKDDCCDIEIKEVIDKDKLLIEKGDSQPSCCEGN